MESAPLVLLLAWALAAPASSQFAFPPFHLQADASGALRVYLPEDCGFEKVKFEWKKGEGGWKGGLMRGGGGPWVYEAPEAALLPGDPLTYTADILYRGDLHKQPFQSWTVPELLPEFGPPPALVGKCENENATTTKPESSSAPEKEETTAATPGATPGTTPVAVGPEEDGPGEGCEVPWLLEPTPGDSRQAVLEKRLARMRCELTKYSRVSAAVYRELTDLKKLNYAMVARMQRLESILRSGPVVPGPSFPPFRRR